MEKERNINVRGKHWSVAPHILPTRDWTNNPGMCRDRELNHRPLALWDDAQLTEILWPGLKYHYSYKNVVYLPTQAAL